MRIANLGPRPPWILVLFVLAVAAFTWWRRPAPPIPPAPIACIETERAVPLVDPEPAEPVRVPTGWHVDPPKPTPGPDVWPRLEACLRTTGWVQRNVTVEDVRRYVEVEHDPVWLEGDSWWLPLSGEGEQNYPSGLYIAVSMHTTACGGAIVN